jgi:hypothetical protein
MPLLQLTDEQIRTWSREQKDRWWLENVYRGDMAQLTVRSAVTGFFLGGVLAATALYIAAKTGITIGVGLTSVILAFAITLSQLDGSVVPDALQPTVMAMGALAGRDVWLVLLLVGLKTVADVWTTVRATRL